jgi:hypothetical protein
MPIVTHPIVPNKARYLIDAFETHRITSFADLGGSWGVLGGYSYLALMTFEIGRAYLVDAFVPPEVPTRFAPYSQFQIIKGAFGQPRVIDAVPDVDAILMFDILLHQVDPDWGQILARYAPKTRHLLIYNQQWVGGDATVRLTDMPPEQYVANTPFAADPDRAAALAAVKNIYAGFGAPHKSFGGKERKDTPDIWQWGITDADLIARCVDLGFELKSRTKYGRFSSLQNFENHGFVFTRA